MDFKISIALFSCLLCIVTGQQYVPWRLGRCLNPGTVQNFNATQFFSSQWYQQQSYGNLIFQGSGICPTLLSRVTNNGGLLIKTYNYNIGLNVYLSLDGTSSINQSTTGQGYLTITFWGLGFVPVRVPFYILGTDYNDWAVIYSCRQRWFSKSEMSFVLVRDRGSNGNTTEINRTIVSAGLNLNNFVPSINTGCGPNEPTL